MSQRRKGQESEKNRRKDPSKIKNDDKNLIEQSKIGNEIYTSKRLKNKSTRCLTKKNNSCCYLCSSKNASKISPSKEKKTTTKKKLKNIENDLASVIPTCKSSPCLSDKTSDSDLIVISEADSGSSEKVSSSSDYSCSPLCNDFNLYNDNNLPSSEVMSENVPLLYKPKCSISVTLNESNLDTEESEMLPYQSAFAATLPSLEVNYESDFSELLESSKTQNTMKDNSHFTVDSNILNENIFINKSQQGMSEHCNSLQDTNVPYKNFLSLINHVNSVTDSKEDYICNQLKILPLIKPPDFNYEENNFVEFAVDIPLLRAASNYNKERSKSQYTSACLPDVCESPWHNSLVRLSDPLLNLSGNYFNHLNSEDNESEISISSCKTSDIHPEFFDLTFSEIPENVSESFSAEHLSDFNLTLPLSLNETTNDLCTVSPIKEIVKNKELSASNDKCSPEIKPKVKRKRKRCIWDTKKRRCRKKPKKKDFVSNTNINLNADTLCDTCDESEVEDNEIDCRYVKPSYVQGQINPSEIEINSVNNQNIKYFKNNTKVSGLCDVSENNDSHDNNEHLDSNSCSIKNSNSKPFKKTVDDNETDCEYVKPSYVQREVNPSEIETNLVINQNTECFQDNTKVSGLSDVSKNNDSHNNNQCLDSISQPFKKTADDNETDRRSIKSSYAKGKINPSETEINSLTNQNTECFQRNTKVSELCNVSENSQHLDSDSCSIKNSSSQPFKKAIDHNETDCGYVKPSYVQGEINPSKIEINLVTNQNIDCFQDNTKMSELCNISENNDSHNNQCLDSNSCSVKNSNSRSLRKAIVSTSETINHFDIEYPQSELTLPKEITYSVDLDQKRNTNDCPELKLTSSGKEVCSIEFSQEINDCNDDSLIFKTCTRIQDRKKTKEAMVSNLNADTHCNTCDSTNCNCVSDRLKNNKVSFETRLSNNTEPIILGLSEDDLDFEFEHQDDLKNEDVSNNDLSNFKSLDNTQDSSKTISDSTVQDNLNKIDSNMNSLDCNINNEENVINSSVGLHGNFSKFTEDSYSSFDDDDSDSDKEYGFKRSHERRSNLVQQPLEHYNYTENAPVNLPEQVCETLPSNPEMPSAVVEKCESALFDGDRNLENDVAANSTNSAKISSEVSLRLEDVKAQIKEYCCKNMGLKAVNVAETFISISPTNDVSKHLFKKLLFSLFSLVINSHDEISLINIFDNTLKLMTKFEMYDKKISSYFIIKCHEHTKLNSYVKKIFDECQQKKMPVNSKAINAFISLLKPEELSFPVLLDYINYIKSVCRKKIPKSLIHSSLEKSKNCKQTEMHNLCEIMYDISSKEVNELNLKEFLQVCFKNSFCSYVAEMLKAWSTKNDLSTVIYLSLVSESEFMAKYYRKLANAIHNDETLHPEQKIMFGQIGAALMLEAFSKNYLNCALEILEILHAYNINYYELELAFCKFYLSLSNSDTDAFDIKILPYLVVFVAVDICLHFERPKDAFTIFQDFSWVTPTENVDQEIKSYVLQERYKRLIKLVPLLNNKDSLHQGWEALKILLSTVEEGYVTEMSEEAPDVNQTKEITPVQCIHSIYNDYLISLINSHELSSAFNLYEHSLGPKRDIFVVKPNVLRGLIVAFHNDGKTEKAKSLFLRGLITDVYSIKKPELSSAPWDLAIISEWTVPEIMFVVDSFISMLSPLLSSKPKETNFEKWFSLKINFKVNNILGSKIECLAETASDPRYYINKTKKALQNMNPSLQCIEETEDEALYITSDSLYSYWKSKYCDSPKLSHLKASSLLHQKQKRFSFGEINPLSENEKSIISSEKKNLQSPLQIQSTKCNVTNYANEIQSKVPTAIVISPETSPNKTHQDKTTISHEMNIRSEKEISPCAYKNKPTISPIVRDSIIQVSNPSRLMDIKEHKVQKERDSVDANSHKSVESDSVININKGSIILPVSSNSEIKNPLKNSVTISSSTPKNKKVTKIIGKQCLKKVKKLGLKNIKNINLNSEKLISTNLDMKNLTISFAANSSTRTVSNSSLNLKNISQNSPDLKAVENNAIEKKINLNKLNVQKETSLSNQPATLNFLRNIPVTNLNINPTEQAMKDTLLRSVYNTKNLEATDSVLNEKISFVVIPQSENSNKIVNSNSVQCKASSSAKKRHVHFNFQDSKPSEEKFPKIDSDSQNSDSNRRISINNPVQSDSSKVLHMKNVNAVSTSVIPQNSDSNTIVSTNSSAQCKSLKPSINRNVNTIPTSINSKSNSSAVALTNNSVQCESLKPSIDRNVITVSTSVNSKKSNSSTVALINNSAQCKSNAKPCINRNVNTIPTSVNSKKSNSSSVALTNNSVQCESLKPSIDRNVITVPTSVNSKKSNSSTVALTNNSAQCKSNAKSSININVNTIPTSVNSKKSSSSAVALTNNSVQCKFPNSKINRNVNSKSNSVIPENSDSSITESTINSIQHNFSKPKINKNFHVTSAIIPQNKDSGTNLVVSNNDIQNTNSVRLLHDKNSTQCKIFKPAVEKISQDFVPNFEKSSRISPKKDSEAIVPTLHSPQHRTSKPRINRNDNLTFLDLASNMKTYSTVISSNKDSDSNTLESNNSNSQCKKLNLTVKKTINTANIQTKVNTVSAKTFTSHANNSFLKKKPIEMEEPKSTQQKVIINTAKTSISNSDNNCNPEEFQKIIHFLETKIAIKHKHLPPELQHQKALVLAETFIRMNETFIKLDKKTMKMLFEFGETNI